MRIGITVGLGVMALGFFSVSGATESNPGRNLAAACNTCHSSGSRADGEIPSLASLNEEEISSALLAFKRAERSGTVMRQLSPGYTDDEIRLVARYLSRGRENAAPGVATP